MPNLQVNLKRARCISLYSVSVHHKVRLKVLNFEQIALQVISLFKIVQRVIK